MKNILKKAISLFLMLAMVLSLIPAVPVSAAAVEVADVGSLWDGFTSGEGTFTVSADSRVYVAGTSAPTGDLLQTAQLIQRQLRAQFGESYFTEMVWGDADWAKTGDIVLNLDTSSNTGADGYKLDVTGTTATVTAADTDGLIYGANNLMKCFLATGSKSISGFSGYDSPDTKERTVSLDCGRKYLSAEWIKNFIRQMSWMGYNTIELHFSDDGGYRADFWDSDYYTDNFSPDNDFSWLCGSKVQYWVYNGNKNNTSYPYSTDPDAGKYLSTKELVEICEVAKEYHIDVIPAFDSPAHMDYITWRFEQHYNSNTSYSFTYGGKTWKASSTKGCINYTGTTGRPAAGYGPNWYYAAVDITEGTMAEAFVLAIYEDIADFFKEYAGSTDFSIGADEVGQGSSVKWTYAEDFPVYINKLNGILNNKGYTMRMFNDFIGTTAYSTTQSFDSNIEIMYWESPFNPNNGGSGASTQPASYFVNEGRTIYNCVQTHTYYVLRIANTSSAATKYTDARNPENRQWTFYHSTEDLIYDEWVPNNVSEKGDYSESVANIPNSNLGGAYFLIWNDYASVSTEAELWNGAPDNTGTNNGVTYYLLDRMASNIIKQWNWDINDTVDYDDFATIRSTFGNFPGFTSCSAEASLPAATAAPEQAWNADHTALAAALADVIEELGNYTAGSVEVYRAAVDAAMEVNAEHSATQSQVDEALAKLEDAEAGLVDLTALETALAAVLTEQGNYTDESWNVYQDAVSAAKTVYADADATKAEVQTAIDNLDAAKDALEEKPADTGPAPDESVSGSILQVEKLTTTARKGKQVGLRIITTVDVTSLSVEGETLNICSGMAQSLDGYEHQVKVWLIAFDADKAGTFTYNITAAGSEGSAVVNITVK